MKKILLLGQNKRDLNNKDLVAAADKLGYDLTWLEYRDLEYRIDQGGLEAYFEGKRMLESNEWFIFRGSGMGRATYIRHRSALAFELKDRKKRLLNKEYYIKFSGNADKLIQHQVMARAGIPVLPTQVLGSIVMIKDSLPPFPFVTKPAIGFHGNGVRRVSTDTRVAITYAHEPVQDVLIQPVVEGGCDYRIIVLGGEVLGGMKRTATQGKFITNISSGGKPEAVEVSNEMKKLAIDAARAFDLEYAGVDIMEDKDGLVVLEVNAQAEYQGFKKATGIDVALEMIKYLSSSQGNK